MPGKGGPSSRDAGPQSPLRYCEALAFIKNLIRPKTTKNSTDHKYSRSAIFLLKVRVLLIYFDLRVVPLLQNLEIRWKAFPEENQIEAENRWSLLNLSRSVNIENLWKVGIVVKNLSDKILGVQFDIFKEYSPTIHFFSISFGFWGFFLFQYGS